MALVSDLTDKSIKLAIAYGRHAVKGSPTKHYSRTYGPDTYLTAQWAGGEGPWEACESAYIKGNPINMSVDFRFHNGLSTDAPDDLFPSDDPHPFSSYWSANMPLGVTSDDLASGFFGIFKCLRTADYDSLGRQIDSGGVLVPSGADPRDYYFYDPNVNPAIVTVDQTIRWGQRLPILVNWSAWDNWKQYNKELISWDDGKYIPANLVLTPIGGGSLTPGTTYYIRMAGENGSELSSAGREWKITLPTDSSGIKIDWIVQEGAAPTGFRIYASSTSGGQHGYFHIPSGSTLTYNLLSLSGTTAGDPPSIATSGLLRHIPRFQANLFFVPPYNLRDSLDRIFQVSCADQQWANGKLSILSPADRSPVFTVDLTQLKPGTFKTYPVDRRSRPNQIQVNYRDLDDPYLAQADPLIIPDPDTTPDTDPRIVLQKNDGQVNTFTIDGGSMTRSQAERVGTFWYRWYANMDQMLELTASPKSYHVLPGDVISVSNELTNWTNVPFKVMKKEEHVQDSLGDPLTAQLYTNGLYSDTDHGPIERPLPPTIPNPFLAPDDIMTFQIIAYDTHGIRLQWAAPVSGTTVARYEIQRLDVDVVDLTHDWYPLATVDVTGWTDTKLPTATTYHYRIRPLSAFGTAGNWTTLTFDLNTIAGNTLPSLTLTPGLDGVTIDLTPNIDMTTAGLRAVADTHYRFYFDHNTEDAILGTDYGDTDLPGLQNSFHIPQRPSYQYDFTGPGGHTVSPLWLVKVRYGFPADPSIGYLWGDEAVAEWTAPLITALDIQPNTTPRANQLVRVAADNTSLELTPRVEISLADYGATGDGITDNTTALQNAINALATGVARKLVIPPGKYKFTAGNITKNFTNLSSQIIIEGSGSGTILIPACGTSVDLFSFQNLESLTVRDLCILGTTGVADDVQRVFSLSSVQQAVFDNVRFYAVSGGSPSAAGIYFYNSSVRVENCAFRGSSFTSGYGRACIYGDTWHGLQVINTDFIDYGNFNEIGFVSKTGIYTGGEWIFLGDVGDITDAIQQNEVIIDQCRFDEGAQNAIIINPNRAISAYAKHVYLRGLRINGSFIGNGIYVGATDRLTVEDVVVTWTTAATIPAINLSYVNRAFLKGFVARANANIIAADGGVQYLCLEDCEYTTLSSSALRTDIFNNGRRDTSNDNVSYYNAATNRLETNALQIDSEITSGGGLKFARVPTGSVAASGTVDATVNWTPNFADDGYTLTGVAVVESGANLTVAGIKSLTAASAVVTVRNNDSGAAHSGVLHLMAVRSRINVAAAAYGATATASYYNPDGSLVPGTHTRPDDAIDGTRYFSDPGGTGYWRSDAALPQWLEIDFATSQTISEIDVYTARDNYPLQTDPTPTEIFTLYGIVDFDVQYWNGSAWTTITSITGNNLVWRKITFSPVTTDKIRINVTATVDGVTRATEVEAY